MSNWPFFDRQATNLSENRPNKAHISGCALQSSEQNNDEVLANYRISYIIGLSILSPVVAYCYTGRFKPLGIFLGASALIILGIVSSGELQTTQSKPTKILLALGTISISVADNGLSVALARRRLRQETDNMK